MSGYNLCPIFSDIARVLMYSFQDHLQPVLTGFLRFFAVPVRGSCILKLSGTGPVRDPSKKGNRTEIGPDFKALVLSPIFLPPLFPFLLRCVDSSTLALGGGVMVVAVVVVVVVLVEVFLVVARSSLWLLSLLWLWLRSEEHTSELQSLV